MPYWMGNKATTPGNVGIGWLVFLEGARGDSARERSDREGGGIGSQRRSVDGPARLFLYWGGRGERPAKPGDRCSPRCAFVVVFPGMDAGVLGGDPRRGSGRSGEANGRERSGRSGRRGRRRGAERGEVSPGPHRAGPTAEDVPQYPGIRAATHHAIECLSWNAAWAANEAGGGSVATASVASSPSAE